MMDTLMTLLGRTENSAEFAAFRGLVPAEFTREVIEDAGMIFHGAPSCGVLVSCNLEGEIRSIFLYLRSRPPYSAYQGNLVPDWLGTSTRTEIRNRLGPVEKSGAARRGGGRRVLPHDRFQMGDALLHLEYDEDDKVSLATVMLPLEA
jgi:hypothetical protein